MFGIIIQARIWAKRFPGKVLVDLGGETVLQHVITRCKRVHDTVIVATPDLALLPIVAKYGARTYLGSENNVLARYVNCAEAYGLDSVMRVTADCPFIDPGVMKQVITKFNETGVDYCSNVLERSYPYGLDCEICGTAVLQSILNMPDLALKYKEHVTLYIREHLNEFKTANVKYLVDLTEYDWRLDSPEDLPLLRLLYKSSGAVLRNFTDMVSICRRGEYLRVSTESRSESKRDSTTHGGAPERTEDSSHKQGFAWYERGYSQQTSRS